MKSLQERLADKQRLADKTKRKRSIGRMKYRTVRIPNFPVLAEGDVIYSEERAREVFNTLQGKCSFEFFQEMRKQFRELEDKLKREQRAIRRRWKKWNWNRVIIGGDTHQQPPIAIYTGEGMPTAQQTVDHIVPRRRRRPTVGQRTLERTTTFRAQREMDRAFEEMFGTP